MPERNPKKPNPKPVPALSFLLRNSAKASLHNDTRNLVRVGVGRRATVLEVTVALGAAFPRNTDRGTAVRDAVCERVDRAGLVTAGKTLIIALTIDGNVLLVTGLELLDGVLNVLHATLLAHVLGREVGVEARAVPVTRNGLRVEGDLGAKLFRHAVEEEASEPEVVTHLDAVARADLELPLGGHDLGVGARDLDAGVQAALVVGLDNVTLNNLASADTAVVGTLGSGETVSGPTVGPVVDIEESVLLLETKPGHLVGMSLHQLGGFMSVVELVGGAIGVPALGEDENVGATTERVREDGYGL